MSNENMSQTEKPHRSEASFKMRSAVTSNQETTFQLIILSLFRRLVSLSRRQYIVHPNDVKNTIRFVSKQLMIYSFQQYRLITLNKV